jgi:hypothetical protein
MKIYKLEQSKVSGYDTYDSCVVIAESEEEAKLISPSDREIKEKTDEYDSWVGKDNIDKIEVTYLGEAKEGSEKGVVCSSFNAG